MYQFTTKLCLVKTELKTLHYFHSSHISSKVTLAKDEWNAAQLLLDQNLSEGHLQTNEKALTKHY
jgi:hypothetical protein